MTKLTVEEIFVKKLSSHDVFSEGANLIDSGNPEIQGAVEADSSGARNLIGEIFR